MADFSVSLWIYAAVPFIEAYRVGSSIPSVVVLIIQLLAQYFTGAAMTPIFWIIYFISTYKKDLTAIRKGDADSVFFGTVVGYLLPTVAMLAWPAVPTNYVWQLFPLVVFAAIIPYRLVASKDTYALAGHNSVSSLYALIFAASLITHLGAFAAHNFNVESFIGDWLAPNPLPVKGSSPAGIFIYMLQWDGLYIFGSLTVAGVWLTADSILESVGIIGWFATTYLVLSPGAAVSAIFWWREKKLEGARKAVRK
ncbi:hypothetical protein M422DRAFT_782654 [Sphaerobolus stellatus SS14]|uniref:Uncharacterized protein n=1 Tax=Sphaerobolus stellatus (strain SS14) TaxID=990650 RepID=A0A0C9VBR4_SPHS4|nr:hypothetical protein M422DRAFT_782654 [Sphaerobolus stellatus SS14]